MPTKLYIGNIPASVSSTELKELFEKYGKVLECDIIKDYAFVVSLFPNN
jgi:RNA recognition motif-containing protein